MMMMKMMLLPLMMLMMLMVMCADGTLPALRWLRWLAEASPPAHKDKSEVMIESRTGIGGRRVWEGLSNLLVARLGRRSWGWED